MSAETLPMTSPAERRDAVARAARVLSEGGLVVFPTETIYGVGVNAASAAGVRRLAGLRGRPEGQSFTVHLGRGPDAEHYVNDMSPLARRLLAKGWPGPLTVRFDVRYPEKTAMYGRLPEEGRAAIYRDGAVGMRCPDQTETLELLTRVDAPVIASSAARAGSPASVDAATAASELGDSVDLVLDGGRCRYARASSVVALHGDRYEVLREGVFDARTIRRLTTLNLLFVCSGNTCRSPMAEGLARKWIADRLGIAPEQLADRGITVASSGSSAMDGMPATEAAVRVCRAMGVSIDRHRSRSLTPDLVRTADHIFTMTESHRRAVLSIQPEAVGRARLLTPGSDIDDPMGGTAEEYEACARRIQESLEHSLKDLLL